MAKKPGPVAGSLGNTDYYYKSDGTVVDENGIPASARISAMFAAPPPVEEAAAVIAPKRKKKNNAQIAGVLKNTKYYYAPDGSIIDDQGKPAPDKIAVYFPPQEKREAIAAAMPKAPGIKAATKTTGVPSKVIKQFNKNISIATNLITTNQKIMESYPKLFEQMSGVVQKMTEQNETVIRTMIQNNQEFQDKVIETLTGAKAPTQAGGSVAPKPGRKGAGRKSLKASRSTAVLARAERMKQSKSASNTRLGIGLAVAGTAVAVGAALIATSPGGSGSSPGGSGSTPGPQAPPVPLGSSGASAGEAGDRPTGKAGFNQIMESAKKAGDPFPEVVAAQWAIESGWGKHMTGKNNPFGQTGVEGREPGVRIPTPRDPGGGSKFFRSFESIDEAVAFRVKKWAPKYAGAKTAEEALMMLQNYGKTPRYAQGYNNDWMSYVTSTSNTIRGMGIDPKVPKNGTQTASTQQTTPAAPSGGPTTAPAPAAATTGAPERRPSATPEEASTHQANVTMLKNINDLAAKKGPGARLGEANEAKKKELEGKVAAFNQKFSLAPTQQAGTVRPLDTTGAPSQQQVQTSLASLGNTNLQKYNTKDQSHIAGLQPDFAGKLGQFLAAAEQAGAPIKIMSGYRSPERQAQLFQAAVAKYGSPEAARKWVAPPGKSNHGRGIAVDLQYSSGQARGWAHQNAAKYGLYFRMSHEPWHIEPQGGASDGDFTPGAPAPDYYAGGGAGNRMAGASQDYAMNRACACPPMAGIINRTVTNDIRTNIFQQMAGPTYRPESMMSPFMIGAQIGSALRRLF
jgi:LAS superfamily LD-carboxypeptidase LdcB